MAAVLIGITATLIALFAAVVSYLVYKSQTDPEVIVYPQGDEKRARIINLVIENVGRAPAYDVTFTSSNELPWKAFAFDENDPPAEAMTAGPLISGIPLLPPGGKRVITWGLYFGLNRALEGGTVMVTAAFYGRHFGIPWQRRHEATSPVEVFSFAGTDASDSNYLKHISEEVKKLVNVAERLAAK